MEISFELLIKYLRIWSLVLYFKLKVLHFYTFRYKFKNVYNFSESLRFQNVWVSRGHMCYNCLFPIINSTFSWNIEDENQQIFAAKYKYFITCCYHIKIKIKIEPLNLPTNTWQKMSVLDNELRLYRQNLNWELKFQWIWQTYPLHVSAS